MNKSYYNLKEVAKILNLEDKEYKIRYWDSKLKLSIGKGALKRNNGGALYFDQKSLKKLKQLKGYMNDNGNLKSPIKLANENLLSRKVAVKTELYSNETSQLTNLEKSEKMHQILNKMRKIAK